MQARGAQTFLVTMKFFIFKTDDLHMTLRKIRASQTESIVDHSDHRPKRSRLWNDGMSVRTKPIRPIAPSSIADDNRGSSNGCFKNTTIKSNYLYTPFRDDRYLSSVAHSELRVTEKTKQNYHLSQANDYSRFIVDMI